MGYEIQVVDIEPTVIAAVTKHVRPADISKEIMPLFDAVWGFLRGGSSPVRPAGHNVAIYRPSGGEMDLEAGVQVSGRFEDAGQVRCSETPGGRAAWTIHMGDYSKLWQAFEAVQQHCRDQGLAVTGVGWEVYGDWHDDPTKVRTDVYLQLA